MKTIASILFLIPFFFLCACSEQVETEKVELFQGDCQKYVELNYSNYDSLRTDPVNIINVKIEDDCLLLTLQYGGGCEEHQVDLALIHPWCGTPPLPPPTFEIRHDSNDDSCYALITKDYSFDISGIRVQGKTKVDFILSVKNSSGTIASKTYTYSY